MMHRGDGDVSCPRIKLWKEEQIETLFETFVALK
jgi:hypothetical protein